MSIMLGVANEGPAVLEQDDAIGIDSEGLQELVSLVFGVEADAVG